MIRQISVKRWARRCGLVVACVPLALLSGCPQDNAGAPGKKSAQSTAPPLSAAAAATSAATTAAMMNAQLAAAEAAQAAPPVDNTAKVQQLINDAEKMYRSGVENYRAGRLDAARMDFDSAVDTMLTSGIGFEGRCSAVG